MNGKGVTLDLTRAEALVLFEWLAQHDSAMKLPVEDEAEQKVLWTLEAQLEKALDEPFASNYADLLANARAEVRDSHRN